MIPLDDYENELLESVENGEWISKGKVDERIKALQSYIKNQNKKAISIKKPLFFFPAIFYCRSLSNILFSRMIIRPL